MADNHTLSFRLATQPDSGASIATPSDVSVLPDAMAQLESVWSLAVEIWEDEATAAEFLGRRHAMLQDRRPLDAILESEDGAVSVREILGRLKYGTAA